jgi:hypothetical protein
VMTRRSRQAQGKVESVSDKVCQAQSRGGAEVDLPRPLPLLSVNDSQFLPRSLLLVGYHEAMSRLSSIGDTPGAILA